MVVFRDSLEQTSPSIQPMASTFRSAAWTVRRSRQPAQSPGDPCCRSSPPQQVAWEKSASERCARSTAVTASSFWEVRYANHPMASLHPANVSCRVSINFPLLIETGCRCFLAGQLHCAPAGSATLKPVETEARLINPDQCRPRDKGKPLERVGRKAKGPNEGRMFQGQPSRHNAVLFRRHWRASSLLEPCSSHSYQGGYLGTGLGGAL